MLESFEALEWRRVEDFSEGRTPERKWISSRWEDQRKADGLLRSRWVLREFATTPGEGPSSVPRRA